ncbi:hypothetical protein N7495_002035 [Penicillium taxi]|uniref:uncharacterized protein n=1 Tax=Penicillium taxi TaxID=168475 RepID=UPI0025450459|nr:uncharacterized protein N7495_002035 [Penicillium taxi]KAJ5901507.1 hypothetical protein N7495_002035 [Penicillium taxi]
MSKYNHAHYCKALKAQKAKKTQQEAERSAQVPLHTLNLTGNSIRLELSRSWQAFVSTRCLPEYLCGGIGAVTVERGRTRATSTMKQKRSSLMRPESRWDRYSPVIPRVDFEEVISYAFKGSGKVVRVKDPSVDAAHCVGEAYIRRCYTPYDGHSKNSSTGCERKDEMAKFRRHERVGIRDQEWRAPGGDRILWLVSQS